MTTGLCGIPMCVGCTCNGRRFISFYYSTDSLVWHWLVFQHWVSLDQVMHTRMRKNRTKINSFALCASLYIVFSFSTFYVYDMLFHLPCSCLYNRYQSLFLLFDLKKKKQQHLKVKASYSRHCSNVFYFFWFVWIRSRNAAAGSCS